MFSHSILLYYTILIQWFSGHNFLEPKSYYYCYYLVLLRFHIGRDRSVLVRFFGKTTRFQFFDHHQNQLWTSSDNGHTRR